MPASFSGEDAARKLLLVSKEDIYSEGQEAVLLLKKGSSIDPALLPKFERYGARASQFELRTDGQSYGTEAVSTPSRNATNPITVSASLPRHRKVAVVLAPEQKHLNRLTDCLFVCGMPLSQIRPVRMTGQLAWSLEKYQPHILVVDFDLHGEEDGITVLERTAYSSLEQVILTVNLSRTGSRSKAEILACAEAMNIALLDKPVNRFALNELLSGS